MMSGRVALATRWPSVTEKLGLKVPKTVGVPVKLPVALLIVMPAGRFCAVQRSVPVPFEVTFEEYATPYLPCGREAVVMTKVLLMVNGTVFETAPLGWITWICATPGVVN